MLGSMCFGQLILILIGTCPAPFMANSVFNCSERKRHLQTEKRDLQKAQIFLGSKMTYELSIMMNLKIITMIFILMS